MLAKVLLVYPGFRGESFWSLTPVCELCNVRRPEPPLGLLTVAALLPKDWKLRLIDRNVRALTPADLDWADMVMTGGMIAQRQDTLAVIELCRARGKPVVVGGPDPTSCEEVYANADFLVLGEAEGIIDTFVAAWRAGQRRGVFRAEKFTVDVTKTPIPRFDLLRANHYLYIGVQFSRGCPFNCEFCDIIELYGRMPRSKTSDQMLAELQAIYDWGHRGIVNFVDDNLIGNKKALKKFLPELASWQAEREYPFMFMTEASINLADDEQLLDMMGQANFFAVFVGIETPDPATLIAIRKKQNTRRSLAESIRKIHAAGMFVIAGFIVGFDGEQTGVADGLIECIEATNIPGAAIGLLSALPNTQLYRRLQREGRLLPSEGAAADDLFAATLNFVPLRPQRDILLDYRQVLAAAYQPAAYFERVRRSGHRIRRPALRRTASPEAAISVRRGGKAARLLPGVRYGFGGLIARNFTIFLKALIKMTLRGDLRALFWRTLIDIARHNPAALEVTIFQMALFLHFGQFAKTKLVELDRQIAALPAEQRLAAE
jgi:radical SAM superfamily enzyme YgiQ (UPF0313 family)